MEYKELSSNLFENIGGACWYLQCISADYDMSGGLALKFNETFDIKNKLLSVNPYTMKLMWTRHGTIANNLCPPFLPSCVICLVTKQNAWEKASLTTVRESLMMAKRYMDMGTIKLVKLPKELCDIDGLAWEDVREIIKQIFTDSDYTFEVYSESFE